MTVIANIVASGRLKPVGPAVRSSRSQPRMLNPLIRTFDSQPDLLLDNMRAEVLTVGFADIAGRTSKGGD